MVLAGGWSALAAAALELTLREVARRPALPAYGNWPAGRLVLIAAAAGVVVALAARRRRAAVASLFAVLFCAGVWAQLLLGARLQSDGFYYFAYLRSIAFDGDVEMSNDYKLLGLGDKTYLFEPTRTGHAHSAWTVGPAIVWSPFFAAGHAVARRLSAHDPNVTANGISFPYRQAVCIAGLVYGLLGCWFTFRGARRFTNDRLAAAATAMTIAGSFMLWYMVKEPSMTHAPSMAAVAGFVWMWVATRGTRTTTQWVLLGAIAGLMTLIRWQNAIFALLPACDSVAALASAWRAGDRDGLRRTLLQGVLFTAAATIVFSPQMLAWRAIYGSWLAVSPIGPKIRFLDPHLVDILWSARNGLFATAPILYAGAIGLLLLARREPSAGVPLLLAAAAMTYFNACIQDWWGSDGFGGRRFDGVLPLAAIGLVQFLAAATRAVAAFPGAAVAAGGLALVLWNLTLMSAANAGVFRLGETVSFGDTMAAQARAGHRWLGNPFTYPASLIYALRNGVAVGRYDLLWTNRFLADPLRPYGTIDVGSPGDTWLLGEGWHDAEREPAATFRWATERATLLVPLDHRADLHVRVRLHAFAHPGAPPQTLRVVVNGRTFGPVPVETGWHEQDLVVAADAWRAGVNDVALELAWARRPVDVGLGGDSRSLGAAVDWVRVRMGE